MHDITEHNTEEEGEGYNSEDSRVDFLECWYTISVNNFLEGVCKFVVLEERGLNKGAIISNQMDLRAINISSLSDIV
jgi:hypothetical protein